MTRGVTNAQGTQQDWRLFRARRMRQLNEAIGSYEQYVGERDEAQLTSEEAQARWKREAELMAGIHEAVHRLRDALSTDIFITQLVSGDPPEERPRLILEKPAEALVNLGTIRDSLPVKNPKTFPERQAAAMNMVDELMAYVVRQLEEIRAAARDKSGDHKEEDEARAIFEFLALVGLYHDKSVVDPQTHDFGQEIWKVLRQKDDKLCRELKEMTPPLTWGETLYHFLDNLEANRGNKDTDRQRKCICQYLFPPREFYCLDCDRPFIVDSRHPGRFICPRCRAKHRKRQERQRKRSAASSQPAL